MSNTARKARKTAALAARFTQAGALRNPRALRALQKARNLELYTARHKEGTPVLERLAFQPRSIFGQGLQNPPTRFGFTSRTAHALVSRGVTADTLNAHHTKEA